MRIVVEIELGATPEDQVAVQAALDANSIPAEVRCGHARFSADIQPWLTVIHTSMEVFVEVADGVVTVREFYRFVSDLYKARREARNGQNGSVGIQDEHLEVALPEDLPLTAYEQLPRLRTHAAAVEGQTFRMATWNSEGNCWRVNYYDEAMALQHFDVTG